MNSLSLSKARHTLAFSILVSSPLLLCACTTSNSTSTYDEAAFTEELIPILSIALGEESQEAVQKAAECIAHDALPNLSSEDLQELASKGFDAAEFSDEGFEIIDTAFSSCTE